MKTTDRPSVPDLAAQLAAVITERGLVPGDPFLTTEDAARHLRVRRDLANRALQVLVQRGRIERSQRVGATVAEPTGGPPLLERVHILVQENHLREQAARSAETQVGLHSALPGCEVDIRVVPTGGAEEFLEPLLRRALRQRSPEGIVLVRCDYPTQRLVVDCGLPAVVHGSTFAGIELSSLDVDGEQMGRLQGETLLAHGCEKIVVLRRDRSLPGDRNFMAGLRDAASRAGLGCDGLDELELAPYPELVQAELESLFRSNGKLGIACATREFADAAWLAAKTAGRIIGEDLWLQANSAGSAPGAPPFPCLVPLDDPRAQGAALGRLLADRLADESAPLEHILVPCTFQ